MKKLLKRAFTIVELVIVIAVIAILAAVLIPTFSNIIKKAQISADVQLCRNLNTVLSYAEAEGRIPGSVYDVLYLENEAGYIIENLNPTSDDMYFAWDQETNTMIYLMPDLETVYYPQEYTLKPGQCWITVGSKEEAEKVAAKGYNLALERDINESIELSNVVSINTLGFTLQGVTMNGGSASVETATLTGNFGEAQVNNSISNIVTSGAISTLDVQGAASVTVSGSVSNFSASSSVSSTVSSTGTIKSVNENSTATIVNNGVVKDNNSSVAVQGENVTERSVATKEDIESIRIQVATGTNFVGETIKMSGDVNMNGIAFMPVSNFDRDTRDLKNADLYGDKTKSQSVWFAGTFDGNNYSINGFSTSGFSIAGLNAGTNSTSVAFGDNNAIYDECVYGLFGTVYNATIKNLTINVNVDLEIDHGNKYVGDSVGAIIGFAYGDEVILENCTVSGTVVGYDGVGALVGRCYAKKLTFKNCVNNATVTGVRKTGAFCGYTSGTTVTFTNCVNNGVITCLGYNKDVALGAKGCTPDSGYYKASWSYCPCYDETVEGLTNNGTATVITE